MKTRSWIRERERGWLGGGGGGGGGERVSFLALNFANNYKLIK